MLCEVFCFLFFVFWIARALAGCRLYFSGWLVVVLVVVNILCGGVVVLLGCGVRFYLFEVEGK